MNIAFDEQDIKNLRKVADELGDGMTCNDNRRRDLANRLHAILDHGVELVDNRRQLLIEAQMQAYPNSEVLTPRAARERWVAQPGPWPKWLEGAFNKAIKEKGRDAAHTHALTYENDTMRAFIACLVNHPDGVLYEQRNPDGTIQFRGCRYGVEPDEYFSPFCD